MSTPTKVRFWSTYAEFCLNMGEIERKQNGKTVTVPRVIRFVRGEYATSDPTEIEALRGCSIYGSKLHEHDPADDEALARLQEAFAGTKTGKGQAKALAKASRKEATVPSQSKVRRVAASVAAAFTPTPPKEA